MREIDNALTWIRGWSDPVIRASRQFSTRERLEFYSVLADLLEDTQGRTSILAIFVRDAGRYAGTPRGILSAHWADRFEASGASLKEAWRGTLPAEEVNMIGVAEKGGAEATIVALRDLARVGEVIRKARLEFMTTISVGLIGVGIAVAMLLALPFFFVPYLKQTFGFVPAEYYGRFARGYFGLAEIIQSTWVIILASVVGVLWWVAWALPNWVGDVRSRIEDRFIVFRLYRDFRGSIFLAMYASLTKSRGGATTTQLDALMMMQEEATPWLRWKIGMMLDRLDAEGGLDATMLDVGVVDKTVYYLFSDIFEARGPAAGLMAAGRRSEERATTTIAARAKVLRWTSLFGALFVVVILLSWQNAVVYEFKGAMAAYVNSR
jgi:hypothetical protein